MHFDFMHSSLRFVTNHDLVLEGMHILDAKQKYLGCKKAKPIRSSSYLTIAT